MEIRNPMCVHDSATTHSNRQIACLGLRWNQFPSLIIICVGSLDELGFLVLQQYMLPESKEVKLISTMKLG